MWPWAAALIGGVGLLTGLGLWVESSVLAPKPTYQQRGVARAPALQVAKAVPELLPAQFSVCATVRADCPPATETCGDLMLLAGTAAMEGGCGALCKCSRSLCVFFSLKEAAAQTCSGGRRRAKGAPWASVCSATAATAKARSKATARRPR